MPRHITVVGATAPSHVHPTLGLVRELTRRGHRVTYAIGEPLVPLVAGAGAEPVACTTLLPQPGTPWPEEAIPAMALFLDEGMHVLPQLRRRSTATRPTSSSTTSAGSPARSPPSAGACPSRSSRPPSWPGRATRRTWRSTSRR